MKLVKQSGNKLFLCDVTADDAEVLSICMKRDGKSVKCISGKRCQVWLLPDDAQDDATEAVCYSGKISLTNPSSVPLALSNEFEDDMLLRERIMDCTSVNAAVDIANELRIYTPKWSVGADNKKYTRLQNRDCFGNIHYLLLYKEQVA